MGYDNGCVENHQKRFVEINEDIAGSGCEKKVLGSVLRDRMMKISSLHRRATGMYI
jgi:hypothetical protein